MIKSYRVTKYNPSMRAPNGSFNVDTWTSSSDIGEVYDSRELTIKDYLTIEDGYVTCIKDLISLTNITKFRISELEDYREGNCAEYRKSFGDNLCDLTLKAKQIINEIELESIIRLSLREELWCKLETENSFIHFGQDFYCYVGLPLGTDMNVLTVPEGIYIEEFESPYL